MGIQVHDQNLVNVLVVLQHHVHGKSDVSIGTEPASSATWAVMEPPSQVNTPPTLYCTSPCQHRAPRLIPAHEILNICVDTQTHKCDI